VSVYRRAAHVPHYCEVVEFERDPFPTIRCACCYAPTVSMGGECFCAACDLRSLLQGYDVADRFP
jgi:hypothetical protein